MLQPFASVELKRSESIAGSAMDLSVTQTSTILPSMSGKH
jgi:hypothetical protein